MAAGPSPGPGDSRDPSLCTVGSRSPASTSCTRLGALEENGRAFPCGRGTEERAQPRRCFRWSSAPCGGSGSVLPILLEKSWQCGEVATDWKRGNIPLQLNGIVMSPQAEAPPGCSSGARPGAGQHRPRAGCWRGKAGWLWLRPLPGGHALRPDGIKMSPQPAEGWGDARGSRRGRARPGRAPELPRLAAPGNINFSAGRQVAFWRVPKACPSWSALRALEEGVGLRLGKVGFFPSRGEP